MFLFSVSPTCFIGFFFFIVAIVAIVNGTYFFFFFIHSKMNPQSDRISTTVFSDETLWFYGNLLLAPTLS